MAVIHHSLDLVLYFIDTTSGLGIHTPPIRLYKNDERLLFQRRSDGQVLVVGCGREDFDLTVELSGYEHANLRVQYDKLNKQLPLMQLHMIPNIDSHSNTQLFTLKGKLEGITALDAIPSTGNHCLLEQFVPKKKQITVFSQYQVAMDNIHYAVRNDAEGSYQTFRVVQQLKPKIFEVDGALSPVEGSTLPILPMNIGQIKQDGSYLLRVPDESRYVSWIIRWQIGDEAFFKTVNFHDADNITL